MFFFLSIRHIYAFLIGLLFSIHGTRSHPFFFCQISVIYYGYDKKCDIANFLIQQSSQIMSVLIPVIRNKVKKNITSELEICTQRFHQMKIYSRVLIRNVFFCIRISFCSIHVYQVLATKSLETWNTCFCISFWQVSLKWGFSLRKTVFDRDLISYANDIWLQTG